MIVSLIITTYNRPDALERILDSILIQKVFPDEVVFADDGSQIETKKIIARFSNQTKIKVTHSWQEDKGFRVARSRNKAIAASLGDYIILVDGDMILHKDFIDDHIKNSETGFFLQGGRVLLSKKLTKKVLMQNHAKFHPLTRGLHNRKNMFYSNFLCSLTSSKNFDLKGIKTCNMSFFKKDFLKVNGFNNLFEGWGKEDSEFVIRLFNAGIKRKNIRFNAIQFHLWHKENTRQSLTQNTELLNKAIKSKLRRCEDGVNRFIKN